MFSSSLFAAHSLSISLNSLNFLSAFWHAALRCRQTRRDSVPRYYYPGIIVRAHWNVSYAAMIIRLRKNAKRFDGMLISIELDAEMRDRSASKLIPAMTADIWLDYWWYLLKSCPNKFRRCSNLAFIASIILNYFETSLGYFLLITILFMRFHIATILSDRDIVNKKLLFPIRRWNCALLRNVNVRGPHCTIMRESFTVLNKRQISPVCGMVVHRETRKPRRTRTYTTCVRVIIHRAVITSR